MGQGKEQARQWLLNHEEVKSEVMQILTEKMNAEN
jgi:hypothetical protein